MTEFGLARSIPTSLPSTAHLSSLDVDRALLTYEIAVTELGIIQKTYGTLDYIDIGGPDQNYHIFSWFILTEETTENPLTPEQRRSLRSFGSQIRSFLERSTAPISFHPTFVRPEREPALVEHLKRNKINYYFINENFDDRIMGGVETF